MLDKLKDMPFSVGSGDVSPDDKFIEGLDDTDEAGATRNSDPDKPRISFRQPKKSPPQKID